MINTLRPFVNELYRTWKYLNDKTHFHKNRLQSNDVRLTFFNKINGLLIAYYLAHSSKVFLYYFYPSIPYQNYHPDDIEHVKNFSSSLNLEDIEKNYASHSNFDQFLVINMLISPWIAFESTIDIIYQSELISVETRQKKELDSYFSVLKILKKQNFEPNLAVQESLKKKLMTNYVSTVQKWNAIFKIIKHKYSRELKKDKIFLEFYQFCRNCMHNNFRANKDNEFITNLGHFIFEKGEYPEFLSPNTILIMLKELINIADEIFLSIDENLNIIDPHSSQE